MFHVPKIVHESMIKRFTSWLNPGGILNSLLERALMKKAVRVCSNIPELVTMKFDVVKSSESDIEYINTGYGYWANSTEIRFNIPPKWITYLLIII